jgi:hypothetical protein
MLDLILGPFLEYGPLGDLNKTSVDGKKEVWYNSKTDITFGDSNTWLIGLGRTTNICGPDIKVVADWTFIEELLSEKFNHKFSGAVGQTIGALLFGVGGASDVLFGVKNLINYGNTQDTTVIRKHTAPLEIKIFKDKSADDTLYPPSLGALILLPYLILLTMVVTIRFANMQVGVFAEESTREKVAKALSVAAPLVESRWIALLLVYEKLTYSASELKKSKANFEADIKKFKENVKINLQKLAGQANNIVITAKLKKIEIQNKIIAEYLDDSKKHSEEEVKKARDYIIQVDPHLGEPHWEYKHSNFPLTLSYPKLTHKVNNAILLTAIKEEFDTLTSSVKVKSKSSFNLTPTLIDFDSAGTKFQFGELDSQKGSINITFSENDGFMRLGADGKSLSNITIRKEALLIQSGSSNNENPTIEMSEGSLKIRCGPAFTGPVILFENDTLTISAGEQILGAGPKFVMTNDSIELTVGIGPAQSALKISSTGVEIKSGEATSTKWSPTSIDMAAAENKIKLGLIELQENAVMLKQNTVAIAEIKAMILMLKGDPALKLDAIIKSL